MSSINSEFLVGFFVTKSSPFRLSNINNPEPEKRKLIFLVIRLIKMRIALVIN